jgi:hypothetical protein
MVLHAIVGAFHVLANNQQINALPSAPNVREGLEWSHSGIKLQDDSQDHVSGTASFGTVRCQRPFDQEFIFPGAFHERAKSARIVGGGIVSIPGDRNLGCIENFDLTGIRTLEQ